MTQSLDTIGIREIHSIALELASNAQLAQLDQFYRSQKQGLSSVILNILLFIPETISPRQFADLVKNIAHSECRALENLPQQSAPDEPYFTTIDVSTSSASRAMDLVLLRDYSLAEFLEDRVRLIDRLTGLSDNGMQLLREFPEICSAWRRGIVGPLAVLHTCGAANFSLLDLERLDIASSVTLLLGESVSDDLEQIFSDVLIPWAIYRQFVDQFCDQLGSVMADPTEGSLRTVLRIVSVVLQSELDSINKRRIASGAMLACYHTPLRSDDSDNLAELQTIVAILSNTFKDVDGLTNSPSLDEIQATTYEEFIQSLNSIGSPFHYLRDPGQRSISLLRMFIEASPIFGSMKTTIGVRFSDAETQNRVLQELLRVVRTESEAAQFRQSLLRQNILHKLPQEVIEYSILKYLLLTGRTTLAKKTYVTTSPRPLKAKKVEDAILEAFHELSEKLDFEKRKDLSSLQHVLGVVHPRHSNERIRRAQLLVNTLVELYTYKGSAAFSPGQISNFKSQGVTDLFSRILQTQGNYRKHFRLLGIYQNLCLALQIEIDENEFKELVINAALSFDDVDSAMQLIEDVVLQAEIQDSSLESDVVRDRKDTTWRLIYQVCKYPIESADVIRKQLDMLSVAIKVCPEENIYELVLLFDKLEKSATMIEEEAVDLWGIEDEEATHHTGVTPSVQPTLRHQDSSTSAKDTKIEMPHWRLFEAAQAATRTAKDFLPRTDGNGESVEGRIRKRDQIAGLVGSGVGAVESRFTSGLGWILGADS